jgi:pimeloyl-ACP methyl ester carboxylesterase
VRLGLLDVAFVRGPIHASGVRLDTLHREPLVLVLPSGHRLARRTQVPLAQLADEPFIGFPRDAAPSLHDAMTGMCLEAGFTPTFVAEAGEWYTIVSLVAAGLGCAILPESVRTFTRAGAVYRGVTGAPRHVEGPSSMTWGLRLSVWCADELPFEDPARIAAQRDPSLGLGGIDEGTASVATCRAWNVAAAPGVENEPVKSDVPALIFAGEFDPDTPPEWGRRLLESLPNARYVEFRGHSHGASFNRCGAQITMAFLRAPSAPLPVDCALELRGADFGTSARPPSTR